MNITRVFAVAAVLGGGWAACAQAALAQDVFDFGGIPGLDVRPSVEINMTPAMLGFVSEASRGTDPDTAALLAGLEGVRVYVYEEIGAGLPAVLEFIDRASTALESDGWQRMVLVRDAEDVVRMYVRMAETRGGGGAGGRITGLTMMVAEAAGEAVFVNVAGDIDPAQFGRLVGAFGMEGVLGNLGGLPNVGGNAAENDGAAGNEPAEQQ